MLTQNKPLEVPPPKPEIKPRKIVPGPEIQPEHPPTLIPQEDPKPAQPEPPKITPVPPEIEPQKISGLKFCILPSSWIVIFVL